MVRLGYILFSVSLCELFGMMFPAQPDSSPLMESGENPTLIGYGSNREIDRTADD
jgi:hypothetical protein